MQRQLGLAHTDEQRITLYERLLLAFDEKRFKKMVEEASTCQISQEPIRFPVLIKIDAIKEHAGLAGLTSILEKSVAIAAITTAMKCSKEEANSHLISLKPLPMLFEQPSLRKEKGFGLLYDPEFAQTEFNTTLDSIQIKVRALLNHCSKQQYSGKSTLSYLEGWKKEFSTQGLLRLRSLLSEPIYATPLGGTGIDIIIEQIRVTAEISVKVMLLTLGEQHLYEKGSKHFTNIFASGHRIATMMRYIAQEIHLHDPRIEQLYELKWDEYRPEYQPKSTDTSEIPTAIAYLQKGLCSNPDPEDIQFLVEIFSSTILPSLKHLIETTDSLLGKVLTVSGISTESS